MKGHSSKCGLISCKKIIEWLSLHPESRFFEGKNICDEEQEYMKYVCENCDCENLRDLFIWGVDLSIYNLCDECEKIRFTCTICGGLDPDDELYNSSYLRKCEECEEYICKDCSIGCDECLTYRLVKGVTYNAIKYVKVCCDICSQDCPRVDFIEEWGDMHKEYICKKHSKIIG